MSNWIKCSDRLPSKSDEHCWIYLTDGTVDDGWFEKNHHRDEWVQSDLKYKRTYEDGWRLDDEYCDWGWLDTVTHWRPYFTPEPPNE